MKLRLCLIDGPQTPNKGHILKEYGFSWDYSEGHPIADCIMVHNVLRDPDNTKELPNWIKVIDDK